jgi:hypothetical protein
MDLRAFAIGVAAAGRATCRGFVDASGAAGAGQAGSPAAARSPTSPQSTADELIAEFLSCWNKMIPGLAVVVLMVVALKDAQPIGE